MSRFFSYLNSTEELVKQYKCEEPLASFLKKRYAQHKKYGSKDRKYISHLCYCYFRLGKIEKPVSVKERILTALFLCSSSSNELLALEKPEWNKNVALSLVDKCAIIGQSYSFEDNFPWKHQLSEGIDQSTFCASFFIQPDVFLRIRPGKSKQVKDKLTRAGIPYNIIDDDSIAVSATTKIDEAIIINKDAVIQDYSSQRVIDIMKQLALPEAAQAWDCCAASGGKSIMLYDLFPKINLTVSDIRESIVANLRKRFSEAGITAYRHFIADLTAAAPAAKPSSFDVVVADVPCSGSGTWSRTPEQLFFFEENKIVEYAALQQKIISSVLPAIKKNGYFLYITCSVFQKENEENVAFIQERMKLKLIDRKIIKGYTQKADTMFAALFRKNE
jgi:16S rRNA (cytosine967-C5)-methyltransferase